MCARRGLWLSRAIFRPLVRGDYEALYGREAREVDLREPTMLVECPARVRQELQRVGNSDDITPFMRSKSYFGGVNVANRLRERCLRCVCRHAGLELRNAVPGIPTSEGA